jgi:hypothetical protein
MAIRKLLSRVRYLVITQFITLILFACNISPFASTPVIIKETSVIKESPPSIYSEPTKVNNSPNKVYPTITPCNPDVVFQRDNARWVEWSPNYDEIYYGINNDPNFSSFSVIENKERTRNGTFENYLANMASQFGIDHLLTNQISPDNLKIVFAKVESKNISTDSNQEHQTTNYVSKIYLKNINQTELFLGDLEGVIESFYWSSDSQTVVIVMSSYSNSSRERGAIYMLNVENKTLKVVLPFSKDLSGYSFHGFSNDNQWVFIASNESTWLWNIRDNTKKYFNLPENRMNWWGYNSETVLVQTNEGEVSQFASVNTSFFWYKIRDAQLNPTFISNYSINPWQSKAVSRSLSLDYLAIIDKSNRLFVVKLCK